MRYKRLAYLLLCAAPLLARGHTSGLHSSAAASAAVKASSGAVNPLSPNGDIKLLLDLMAKFKNFAYKDEHALEERHAEEKQETVEAVDAAVEPEVKMALEEVANTDDASLLAAKKSLRSIIKYSNALDTALGNAYESTKGCANIICGQHASCTETTLGGECVCDEGYVGNGQDCHAPESYLPQKLLVEGAAGMQTEVAELHVTFFMGTKVAVVWRDVTNKNIGRIMIGTAPPGEVKWAPAERFSARGSKAFQPLVVGFGSNRLIVSYRDEAKEGACWLRGGEVGVSRIRGADLHITWGEPVRFCRGQSHQHAMVPLPQSRVAVFWADSTPPTATKDRVAFGKAALAQVDDHGAVTMLGDTRFTEVAALRLEATLVTPTSFVISCRSPKMVDEMDTTQVTLQEAKLIYGEMVEDDLVFDPDSLNLEPEKDHVWARGLSLIAPNTIGYAYQMGKRGRTKLTTVHVDPETHKMTIANKQGSIILSKGFSPYVSMINYPYAPNDPHTFVYYQKKGKSLINICRYRPQQQRLAHCEDIAWMRQPLKSVDAIALGGGRLLFVYATEHGVPYYQLMGVSKK